MSDTTTTKELLSTKEIEQNTKALQELQKALLAYQEALKKPVATNLFSLDGLKKITTSLDTLSSVINKLKKSGEEGLGLTNYVTLS